MNNRISRKVIIVCATITIVIIAIIIYLLVLINSKSGVTKKSNININDNNNQSTSYRKDSGAKADYKQLSETKQSGQINKNNHNDFTIQAVTEEKLLSKYLEDYQYNAINHIEDAYNSLDKEYREKRFDNLKKYEEYLNDRQEIIKNIKLSKYQINKYENYEQYICIDLNDNYYIFNKFSNMKYSILLDTYTTNLPQFIERYNTASEGEKVGLNIEKFINALNEKDYQFSYNVLDETFKANNMPNLNEFENYVRNNFFEKNSIEHLSAEREGDYIIYKTRLTDKNLRNQDIKNFTIIMKLLENTDFVMSFSFE